MKIYMNGEICEIQHEKLEIQLDHILNLLPNLPKHFAVMVNDVFVPRSLYEKSLVKENDCLAFITPMQGG